MEVNNVCTLQPETKARGRGTNIHIFFGGDRDGKFYYIKWFGCDDNYSLVGCQVRLMSNVNTYWQCVPVVEKKDYFYD